jgi:DNA replication protein DnaC
MKRSGLYNLLERYTMDTYRVSEPWQANIRDKAQEFVEQTLANQQSEDWFFIGGASGSGKTHICTAICRELLYKGMSVRYMQWRDAAVKLKAVANDFVEYAQRMDSWKNAKVLYVDDLFKSGSAYGSGRQQPTAADINLAFELLNHRYNNPELITILSSECTLHNLLDIDEAIGGRIAERAKGFTVNLAAGRGKNYRTKVTGA